MKTKILRYLHTIIIINQIFRISFNHNIRDCIYLKFSVESGGISVITYECVLRTIRIECHTSRSCVGFRIVPYAFIVKSSGAIFYSICGSKRYPAPYPMISLFAFNQHCEPSAPRDSVRSDFCLVSFSDAVCCRVSKIFPSPVISLR